MNANEEKVEQMNVYANDLVRKLVRDEHSLSEEKLKIALENVVRAMVDLTNIHLEREKDADSTLRATLSKMKIAHNCLNYTSNMNK